jgi:hypothetical protein
MALYFRRSTTRSQPDCGRVTGVTSGPGPGLVFLRCLKVKSEVVAQFCEARHSGTRQGKGLAG